MKRLITHSEVSARCAEIAKRLPDDLLFYGVPRGGIAPAYMIAAMAKGEVVDDPTAADIFIDDLIDSGATKERYDHLYPGRKFFALFGKDDPGDWLVFPWEVTDAGADESGTDIFVRLLQFVGEDVEREGLLETPARMAKMYRQVTAGYAQNPSDYFKVFTENASTYDEMVILSPIPFFSLCEHHLLPFFGEVSIGYIPDRLFAGLSKFARVVETFSKRLQIQERLAHQIADTLQELLRPRGVGVVIRARHLCMEMRGIQKPGVHTITSAMKGRMLTDEKARAEFLSFIK